jgi:uncharacterized membrane protein YfcA
MAVDWRVVGMMAVIFIATTIRAAFGFGEALIAVPLLALLIPVEVAVPVAVLVSVTVAAVIIIQDWEHVHFASAWRLVIATLFGIPLGLWLLTAVPEPIVKAILAVVIIAFAVYCLVDRRRAELTSDRPAWFFGFLAGILGGAYGINGPPLVVYGALRHWSPERFRATLQGYFLPASVVGMFGYWLAGLWVPEVTRYFLLSLPPAAVAMFAGHWLNRRMKGQKFFMYIHACLILVGISLLAQAIFK